jgi:hypothetical protein
MSFLLDGGEPVEGWLLAAPSPLKLWGRVIVTRVNLQTPGMAAPRSLWFEQTWRLRTWNVPLLSRGLLHDDLAEIEHFAWLQDRDRVVSFAGTYIIAHPRNQFVIAELSGV